MGIVVELATVDEAMSYFGVKRNAALAIRICRIGGPRGIIQWRGVPSKVIEAGRPTSCGQSRERSEMLSSCLGGRLAGEIMWEQGSSRRWSEE